MQCDNYVQKLVVLRNIYSEALARYQKAQGEEPGYSLSQAGCYILQVHSFGNRKLPFMSQTIDPSRPVLVTGYQGPIQKHFKIKKAPQLLFHHAIYQPPVLFLSLRDPLPGHKEILPSVMPECSQDHLHVYIIMPFLKGI